MSWDANDTEKRAVEQASVLRTAGQRRVNLIWELTQASIAIGVTGTTLWVASHSPATQEGLLSNAFFLVIGFYFGRTNHQRTGGVGPSEIGR